MKKRWMLLSLASVILAGCQHKPRNPQDPYENFNRAMFAFNQDVDHLLARPATKVYDTIVPPPMRRGVHNVFTNIDSVYSFPNDLLQGKVRYALLDAMRFLTNATLGIGGLFDTASALGMPKHYNDLGMTLAYYSKEKKSPYLMIPLLGPSTFRDGLGRLGNVVMNPMTYSNDDFLPWIYIGVDALDQRSQVMDMNRVIDEAFDPYIAVRNAYLQHRNAVIRRNEKDLTPKDQRKHGFDLKPLKAKIKSS